MRIKYILARLKRYIKELKNDQYHLGAIYNALQDIEKQIAELDGKELTAESPQLKEIALNLQRISQAIQNLSVRRGHLMARQNGVPWKMLMFLTEALNENEKSPVLVDFLNDFIKHDEIVSLKQQFGDFKLDIDSRVDLCESYYNFIKTQAKKILPILNEELAECRGKEKLYSEVITVVQAIKNIITQKTPNMLNLQSRLSELEGLKGKVINSSDDQLIGFIKKWESEIGFINPVKIDASYTGAIKGQEEFIRCCGIYNQGMNTILADNIAIIENLRAISQFVLISKLEEVIKALNGAKNEETLIKAKLLCYDMSLKLKLLDLQALEINNFLLYAQKCSLADIKGAPFELERIPGSFNRFPQQMELLLNLKKIMFGERDDNLDRFLGKFKDDAKAKSEKKTFAADEKLVIALDQYIVLLKESAKYDSALKVHIDNIIIFLETIKEAKEPEKQKGVTIKVNLKNHEDELRKLFDAALTVHDEKKPDIDLDRFEQFTIIDKYYDKIASELKKENEDVEAADFCPILLRLLQYHFDQKNLTLAIITINSLLQLFAKEQSIKDPAARIAFLQALIVIGESTKDLSGRMKAEGKNIPWTMLRIIRNDIFHVLIDFAAGRKFFWEFVLGHTDKIDVNACLGDLQTLKFSLEAIKLFHLQDKNWKEYPAIELIKKKKNTTADSALKIAIIKIAKADRPAVESKSTIDPTKYLALAKMRETFDEVADYINSLRTKLEGTEQAPEQIRQAIENIKALENYFMMLNQILLPALKGELLTSQSVFNMGMAYCGGLLKILKDTLPPFQREASPILLEKAEENIFLRGELAHTIAAKGSLVNLETLLAIKRNILILLKNMEFSFELKLMPEIRLFDIRLDGFESEFLKLLDNSQLHVGEADKYLGASTNIEGFVDKDMKKLRSLYHAIQFYQTEHGANQVKYGDIIINLKQSQEINRNELAGAIKMLLELQKRISNYLHEDKPESNVSIVFEEEKAKLLSEIDKKIEQLQKQLDYVNGEGQQKYVKLIEKLEKLCEPPEIINKLIEMLQGHYGREIDYLKFIDSKIKHVKNGLTKAGPLLTEIEDLCAVQRAAINKLWQPLTTDDQSIMLAELLSISSKHPKEVVMFLHGCRNELGRLTFEQQELTNRLEELKAAYNDLIGQMKELKNNNKAYKDSPSDPLAATASICHDEIMELRGKMKNEIKKNEERIGDLNAKLSQFRDLLLLIDKKLTEQSSESLSETPRDNDRSDGPSGAPPSKKDGGDGKGPEGPKPSGEKRDPAQTSNPHKGSEFDSGQTFHLPLANKHGLGSQSSILAAKLKAEGGHTKSTLMTESKPDLKQILFNAFIKITGEDEDADFKLAVERSLADSNVQQVKEELKRETGKYCFNCKDVPGDGNCFFSVVADQLKRYDVEVDTNTLRMKAIQEILNHPELYRDFVDNIDTYIDRMFSASEWADHVIISALCRALNLTAVIVNSDGSDPIIFRGKDSKTEIYLGYEVNRHYQSLHPTDGFATDGQITRLIQATEYEQVVRANPSAITKDSTPILGNTSLTFNK